MKRASFKIMQYFVMWPLIIVYIGFSYPPTYSHYRVEWLAHWHKVYEKDQARKKNLAMIDLGNSALPKMATNEREFWKGVK